jgi:hypothetical protein
MIGSPFTKHTSDKNGDNNEMRDVDERCTMDVDNTEMRDVVHERDARDVELGDMAAAKELEQGHMASVKEESELIKVVEVLHMVRCREITEYNLKLGRYVPTRFCFRNIALFDLDKECEYIHSSIILVCSIRIVQAIFVCILSNYLNICICSLQQNLGVGHRSNRSIARNIHGWCTL